MPDFSKDQSNKIQVWFKRGYNHKIKVQFIEDPLLRTQVDPILVHSGSWQIGKKIFKTEQGNNTTLNKQYFFRLSKRPTISSLPAVNLDLLNFCLGNRREDS
jgi:hypothetical protein